MDWFRQVNSYCERRDGSYWAEPANALTNLAFLLAAWLCWRRPEVRRDGPARLLTAVLGLIGIGSWLFHTHAQVWTLFADVIPIQAFILVYVACATARFFARPWWAGGRVGAVPWRSAAGLGGDRGGLRAAQRLDRLPARADPDRGLCARPAPRAPETALGLGVGAGVLVVSRGFRTIDQTVCPAFPLGTRFLWHLLNAAMLGWMILVLARAKPPLEPEAGGA